MSENYERVRHLKRGIEAEVLGEAEVQIATTRIVGEAPGKALLIEGDKLTIYREGDKLWARFPDEFRDGRFETIAPAEVTEQVDSVGALKERADLFKLISGKLLACEWTDGAFLEPEQWELILKCLAFWSPAPAQASPVGGERYRPASTAFPPEVKEHLARRVKAIEGAWLSEKHEYPEVGQVTFLLRLANAYLDLPEVQPAAQERADICRALGCVDKPGVPLQFVKDLQARCDKQWARINELHKTWDEASLTERQELDRFRRGWGPSTPTERELRRNNVASALQAVSIAMTEVSVSEDEIDDVPEEARARLDEAYDRLNNAHTSLLTVLHSIVEDPQEWPDVRAAEERGAAAMRQVLIEMVGGLEIIGPNLMAAWRYENKGVAEAVSMIKLAPSPHDYEGTRKEEIKATLSKVEIPVPKACAEIIDAARRLYALEQEEAATRAKLEALDQKIVRCSQLEEGLAMMQQRIRVRADLEATQVARRIAQIDVSSALMAALNQPKGTTEQKAA